MLTITRLTHCPAQLKTFSTFGQPAGPLPALGSLTLHIRSTTCLQFHNFDAASGFRENRKPKKRAMENHISPAHAAYKAYLSVTGLPFGTKQEEI